MNQLTVMSCQNINRVTINRFVVYSTFFLKMVQIKLTMECGLCASQFDFSGMFAHMADHSNATLSDMYVIVDHENIQAIFLAHMRRELRSYVNNLAKQGAMVDVLLTSNCNNQI